MKLSLWERVCSQLWSSKTFFQHGFVREIARTTSRRDREKYETTEWIWRDWRSIDNVTTIGVCTGLGCFHSCTQILNTHVNTQVCTNAHHMICMLCVLTKMCEAFLHMIVCKHSIYRVRKWTDQIELNYKFCFCFFLQKYHFFESKSVCP